LWYSYAIPRALSTGYPRASSQRSTIIPAAAP